MAIGTVTATKKHKGSSYENLRVDVVSFTGDASYATGGFTDFITKFRAAVGDNRQVVGVFNLGANGGYVPQWDDQTERLKLFTSNGAAPAGLAELANAANTSGVTFRFAVLSI